MASSDISAKSFMTEMMKISLNLIWKDPYYAITNEDLASNRVAIDTYMAARQGILRFNSVFSFHEEVLQMYFPNPDELALVVMDKKMIPENLRDDIVASEASFVINQWENENGEPNPYYRMLFGLPPLEMESKDWVYNTEYADIDMTTPVHLLPYTDRLRLESKGYFKKLRESVPYNEEAYGYLDYLGKFRIYPYIARSAEAFQLLYVQSSQYEHLRDDFIDTYEEARRMVLRVYYSDAYRNKSHIYEGFLALCILFITQQRMMSRYLEADVSRDFYDMESLKLLYDAYQVPFYSEIPLKYHERIVKHLNELIAYKGSTQVFYDLFELFDFGTMEVFEYYLLKERKVDENGNPIFRDADGNPLSARDMWNIRFARVNWSADKYVELTRSDNAVPYEELTDPDPYWINDTQLLDKLYESDWNYFQSKYMGVEIMFDLSKLMFETCYFLGMLRDNRSELSQMTCYYAMTATDVPIFDMFVYTIALLCYNAGYTGEIPSDPASVAAIYGFNFKEYNQLLKMGAENMDDFVKGFKAFCHSYVDQSDILSADQTLSYLIDQITDGAFNWLGDDFPYNTWGHAPTPIFLHDFIPTNNSVTTLKKYLKETVETLRENPDLNDFELNYLYKLLVTHDNTVFNVVSTTATGQQMTYDRFVLKSMEFNDEDLATLRQAVILSYEKMFDWIIKLLDARTALTMDPQLLQMIADMNVDSVEDIDRVYTAMEELNDYITAKIRTASSKYDYEAYSNLRKILMTTTLMNETFTKRDGSIARTYSELLEDINPDLYKRFINEDVDKPTEEQYAIQTLMRLCYDLTLLESVNTTNIQRVVQYLFKILSFFKSAKVDLVDFEIIYLITDRGLNYIKLVTELHDQLVTILPNRNDAFYLWACIWACFIVQYLMSHLHMVDKDCTMNVEEYRHDVIMRLVDEIASKEISMEHHDYFQFIFDEMRRIDLTVNMHSGIRWKDSLIKASETVYDDETP